MENGHYALTIFGVLLLLGLASDYLGADTIVTARVGGQELLVRVPGHRIVSGIETVHLRWPAEKGHAFDAATGRRIGTSAGAATAT